MSKIKNCLENKSQTLKKYSQTELCEIYHQLNSWEWDDRLGEKPEGYDDLIGWRYKWYHVFTRPKTKYEVITPIINEIKMIVPRKELLRHHHLVNIGSTNEEFEKWWCIEEREESDLPKLETNAWIVSVIISVIVLIISMT